MDNIITESVSGKTTNTSNPPTEIDVRKGKEKIGEEYVGKEVSLKKNYNAVSKNGDTLELSEAGRALGEQKDVDNQSFSGKSGITDSVKKISDIALARYSKAQLKQLYASKKITKQQYERFQKKAK